MFPGKSGKSICVITPSDEVIISQAGAFDSVEFNCYDSRNSVGCVEFQASFFDNDGNMVHKANLSPVVMKREKVCVLKQHKQSGEIITAGRYEDGVHLD